MTTNYCRDCGFTLIELLVSLMVVGVLANIAIPSLIGTVQKSQIISQTNNLVSSILLTRNEAVKQGVQITIRHNDENSQAWMSGWKVFTDWNGNGVLDEQDSLLREQGHLPVNIKLSTVNRYSQWLAYNPLGQPKVSAPGLANGSFTLCSLVNGDSHTQKIFISSSGRLRTQQSNTPCI